MKGNQFYTVFGIVTAVLVAAVGFFCFKSYSAYKDAGGQFETRRKAMIRLKEGKPYPNKENLEKIEKGVTEYRGEIMGLFQILDRFQQPLSTVVDDTQFPQALKAKLAAFKTLAEEKGMKIAEDQEFYMAMDAYINGIPNPKAVPLLDYQLGAIDYLLKILVESGVTELISLDRELLPVEASKGNEQEGAQADSPTVVAKYPLSLTFETKHSAFQSLVNKISNDDKYFFIIRALRVDNSSKEGPTKGAREEEGAGYVNAVTGEPAPEEVIAQISPNMTPQEQVNRMKEKGFVVKTSDARVLMGDEKLRVFMVVDLVRFADATKKMEKDSGSGDKKGAGANANNK